MNLVARALSLGLCCWLSMTVSLQAETKVTLKGVHLCCGACVKAVEKTLADVKGAKGACDQDARTIALTADNDEAAQKAIDALLAAGFRGKPDSDKFKLKAVETPKGNVQRLELTGVHNCCGACTRAIKGALKDVKGVESDTVKPKSDSFVVEGDFAAAELVEALLDAGFQVEVKK